MINLLATVPKLARGTSNEAAVLFHSNSIQQDLQRVRKIRLPRPMDQVQCMMAQLQDGIPLFSSSYSLPLLSLLSSSSPTVVEKLIQGPFRIMMANFLRILRALPFSLLSLSLLPPPSLPTDLFGSEVCSPTSLLPSPLASFLFNSLYHCHMNPPTA